MLFPRVPVVRDGDTGTNQQDEHDDHHDDDGGDAVAAIVAAAAIAAGAAAAATAAAAAAAPFRADAAGCRRDQRRLRRAGRCTVTMPGGPRFFLTGTRAAAVDLWQVRQLLKQIGPLPRARARARLAVLRCCALRRERGAYCGGPTP